MKMNEPSNESQAKPSSIRSLEDRIVKYDFRQMKEELSYEFTITSSSSALVDQVTINNLFNLEDLNHARN